LDSIRRGFSSHGSLHQRGPDFKKWLLNLQKR